MTISNNASGSDAERDGASIDVGDHRTRTTRLLSKQCQTCIFRPGNPMFLTPGRLHELVNDTLAADSYIICHSTLPGMGEQVSPAICRGFHDRYDTLALRLIQALWGFTEVEPPSHSAR